MSKVLWRVIYKQGARLKDRCFSEEAEAREFVLKQRKYLNDYRLEKISHIPIWDRWLRTRITWFNLEVPILFIVLCAFMGYGLWEILK
jgi:predicted ribosome quality control (RQC) complex YloA/Tae2 family protein